TVLHSIANLLYTTVFFIVSLLFFFFFQAEDGIRDATVTGVQTCALPIYTILLFLVALEPYLFNILPFFLSPPQTFTELYDVTSRSEERRVGKECRSRGWAYY